MKKKMFGLVMGMALIISSLAGCADSNSKNGTSENPASTDVAAGTQEKTNKVYKIGVSTQSWKYEFLKNMVNALKKIDGEMPNVELILLDSEDSVEKQLGDVDTLISQGVDGVILNALSFEGSSTAVDSCKTAGIPLVELVSYTENEGYDTFVGTDVKSSGIMAGDLAAKAIEEKGTIFELQGVIGHTAQINRGAGIAEALQEYTDIQLVESQSGEFSKDKAMSVTEAWLAKYPEGEIDAIIAHNDQMALGAMNACIAANRPEIKIVGIDGDAEALEGVTEGKMAATVVDYCEEECKLAVEEMVSILEGNPAKGKIMVDYVAVSTPDEAKKFLDLRK